jgi:hypothetical protein
MLFFAVKRFFFSTLLVSMLLSSFDFAEARILSSSVFFKGKYKNRTVYGTINSWDNRICTVINSKIVVGQLNNSDSNTAILAGKKVVITEYLLRNPVDTKRIPSSWFENKKFQECSNKLSYATCTIKSDSKYYSNENELFRGRIESSTKVFVLGENTTSLYVEDEEKEVAESWADFSFSLNEQSINFITAIKNINCKSK